MEAILNQGDVKEYLLKNREFTDSFFAEHATSEMVQKWFQRRSKAHAVGNHYDAPSRFSLAVQQEVSEEESAEESPGVEQGDIDSAISRRNSEPYTATANRKTSAFRVREMRKKKALTEIRQKPVLSQTFDEVVEPEGVSKLVYLKPSLRKTQSAPICKDIFNRLINSSVYLHNLPSHDWQYKLDLRSASEDTILNEVIQDIMQDLNLKTLCKKLVLSVGIITDACSASLFLVEKKERKKILRVCFEEWKFDSGKDISVNAQFSDEVRNFGEDDISRVAESGQAILTASEV